MAGSRTNVYAGRIFDSVIGCLIIGVLALSISGFFEPRGSGFFCDDPSIKYPYRKDTVSIPVLLAGSLLAPLLFIVPTECLRQHGTECSPRSLSSGGVVCKKILKKAIHRWGYLLKGQLAVLALTELAKAIVSEPRPHFWQTCQPEITDQDCITNKNFIREFNCTSGASRYAISDAQKSFPSAHAALSVYACCYMLLYLRYFVEWQQSFLLQFFLQLLWASFALFASLTRITDHRHHWWDVMAGAVLGLCVALFIPCPRRRVKRVAEGEPADDILCGDVGLSQRNAFTHRGDHNSSRKLSVRRLLSTSSSTCGSIAEDQELQDVHQGP